MGATWEKETFPEGISVPLGNQPKIKKATRTSIRAERKREVLFRQQFHSQVELEEPVAASAAHLTAENLDLLDMQDRQLGISVPFWHNPIGLYGKLNSYCWYNGNGVLPHRVDNCTSENCQLS